MSPKYVVKVVFQVLMATVVVAAGVSSQAKEVDPTKACLADLAPGVSSDEGKKQRTEVLDRIASEIKINHTVPELSQLAELLGITSSDAKKLIGGTKAIDVLMYYGSEKPSAIEQLRNSIAKVYADIAREIGRTPTQQEFASGASLFDRQLLFEKEYLFKDFSEVKQRAREAYPKVFKDIVDTDFFSIERSRKIAVEAAKHKRILVTSAIAGQDVDRNLFDSLLNYANLNDAMIIVLPINMITSNLDPILFNTPNVHVLVDSLQLTPWMRIENVRLMAKMFNPLTNMQNLRKKPGETLIIGSPRLDAETIATTDNSLRNEQLFTVGSLNGPQSYNAEHFVGKRTDRLAESLHRMGALLLERTNSDGAFGDKKMGDYHIRRLEYVMTPDPVKKPWARNEIGITDKNMFYTASEVREQRPEALVLGDLHVATIDTKILESLIDLIKTLKPKRIVLHDIFDGNAISHWDTKSLTTMMRKAQTGEFDLKQEISRTAEFLNSLLALDPNLELIVAKANHDLWLNRFISDGTFGSQPINAPAAFELGTVMHNSQYILDRSGQRVRLTNDPLEYALLNGLGRDAVTNRVATTTIFDPRRIIFLDVKSTMKLGNEEHDILVELGNHGDRGANGAKGSAPRTMAKGGGRIIFGHTHHELRIVQDGMNIGTFTPPRVGYNQGGFSSWGASVGLVSPNGEMQALQLRNGRWFSNESLGYAKDSFFAPNLPLVIPENRGTPNDGGVDQYSQGAKVLKNRKTGSKK